jgi:glyoxylase-like metal-dependent hydrolase (beta-lactamase superfamily II)
LVTSRSLSRRARAVPAAEAPLFRAWDEKALLYAYADQSADRFTVDETIEAGSTHAWGGLEWRALAAPGHDMGALVFFNPGHRVLISGDALWENGFGFVMPRAIDPGALPATRATLDMIASLDVRAVIPGHGEPFADVGPALERAYARLEAFEADDEREDQVAVVERDEDEEEDEAVTPELDEVVDEPPLSTDDDDDGDDAAPPVSEDLGEFTDDEDVEDDADVPFLEDDDEDDFDESEIEGLPGEGEEDR